MPHPPYTPPEVVWMFRQRFSVTHSGLADLLSLDRRTVERFEQEGGPAWLCYALAGLALGIFGASEFEAQQLGCPERDDRG